MLSKKSKNNELYFKIPILKKKSKLKNILMNKQKNGKIMRRYGFNFINSRFVVLNMN